LIERTEAGRKQLMSLGLAAGAFFILLGLAPLRYHGATRGWALAFGALFAAVAVFCPRLLRRPYAGWMALGKALGWVNTRVLLGLIFWLLFTPFGFILRLMRKDPMNRAFDHRAGTYRIPRQPRPASHMDNQF
jgi:hypothetical protein